MSTATPASALRRLAGVAAGPASIKPGTHYIVVDALFSYALPNWGTLNWRAFIEPESGAVLFLRALVDGVTGLVFDRDPITKTGNLANLPSASNAILDPAARSGSAGRSGAPSAGHQNLSGTFVRIANVDPPTPAIPTTIAPFNFAFDARTDDFAAVNAYYHCDRFFRTVRDIGFNIPTYFDGTAFPVPVDHHALGNVDQRAMPRQHLEQRHRLGGVLACRSRQTAPLGIAADWRVVLHELGGHGILWDHVDFAEFRLLRTAPATASLRSSTIPRRTAPDRFVSFPWVNIGRRHDRPVAGGWGWGGANDLNGYFSEQILATSHFRLYRSIGGDSASLARRQFAASSAVYLILRAVGQLTPVDQPGQRRSAGSNSWKRRTPSSGPAPIRRRPMPAAPTTR